MDDLKLYKDMLDRSGFKYEEETNVSILTHYADNKYKGTILTVEGSFYDDLYVEFNLSGELIHMWSHVATNRAYNTRALITVGEL